MSSKGTGSQWLDLTIAGGLICTSALFSGLTLGLMSLDLSSLSVLAEAGDEREREYAKKIIPLRRNGNLLLCTLLIGNTVVNSFLSILVPIITEGLPSILALLIAPALIVIFGEIAPQAICSRHGLLIGSRTRYVTWACVGALFFLAWPISKVLDFLLGREVGTMYSREELKHLIKLQVNVGAHPSGDGIDADEHNILAGALEYSNKEVKDVMTPIEKVFMLEASTKLTFDAMLDIYKSGYTRIPVYDGTVSKDRVISVLYVKDLILVDPDDEIEVQTVVSFRGPSQVRFISDQTPLNEVFKIFKTSFSHLMISIAFYDPDSGERLSQEDIIQRSKAKDTRALSIRQVTGVITLEDILEEVIKAEIIDEHDTFVANDSMQKVHKGKGRPDMATFLSLFDHKAREHSKLSRQEVHAITAFLTARVKEFALFETAPSQLRQLVQHSTVIDVDEDSSDSGASDDSLDLLTQVREEQIDVGAKVGSHTVLYRRGECNSTFTLVLQGRACVWAGSESFQSEIAPWSCIGNNALLHSDYTPDFTAVTAGACRLLQISRKDFEVAATTVRKAQEARAQRFSGSIRDTPIHDRRRSRFASDGQGVADKDLASLTSQGSIVINSPAQPRDHLSLVMHGHSASMQSAIMHGHSTSMQSAANSPMQSSRESKSSKLNIGHNGHQRLSSSHLQPAQQSGLALPPASSALLSSKHGRISSMSADNIIALGGSGDLRAAVNGAARNANGASTDGGAVLANASGAGDRHVGTGDHGWAVSEGGQSGSTVAESTVAPLNMSTGVSPFATSASSGPMQRTGGASWQDGAAHSAHSGGVTMYGAADNALEGSNGALQGATGSTNGATMPGTPAQNSSILAAGCGGAIHSSHNTVVPTKSGHGVERHHDHSHGGAAAGLFSAVTGVCTPAGGSSAPQSGSVASLRGAMSSRTGEQHTTHDSEALRGIVMLGDGGEPMCLDVTGHGQGDMFMEDVQNSVEDAAMRRWERQGTMKRGSHDTSAQSPLPLAPVESGAHSALFRAMTPGETMRRQQPGWRQSHEWNSPQRDGSGEDF